MVVACAAGQGYEGGTEYTPRTCLRCDKITYITTTYCALCCIQEELGMWKRPEREVYVWP